VVARIAHGGVDGGLSIDETGNEMAERARWRRGGGDRERTGTSVRLHGSRREAQESEENPAMGIDPHR
jgi:hypothetical protein